MPWPTLIRKKKVPPAVSVSLYKPDRPMGGFNPPNYYRTKPMVEKSEEPEQSQDNKKKKQVEEEAEDEYYSDAYIQDFYGPR
jgi:hypothetical protein